MQEALTPFNSICNPKGPYRVISPHKSRLPPTTTRAPYPFLAKSTSSQRNYPHHFSNVASLIASVARATTPLASVRCIWILSILLVLGLGFAVIIDSLSGVNLPLTKLMGFRFVSLKQRTATEQIYAHCLYVGDGNAAGQIRLEPDSGHLALAARHLVVKQGHSLAQMTLKNDWLIVTDIFTETPHYHDGQLLRKVPLCVSIYVLLCKSAPSIRTFRSAT